MERREELEILMHGVNVALDCFYENDGELIQFGVGEPCLVGNFYRYFRKTIRGLLQEDPALRVD